MLADLSQGWRETDLYGVIVIIIDRCTLVRTTLTTVEVISGFSYVPRTIDVLIRRTFSTRGLPTITSTAIVDPAVFVVCIIRLTYIAKPTIVGKR